MDKYKGFIIRIAANRAYIETDDLGIATANDRAGAEAIIDGIVAADLKGAAGKQYRITLKHAGIYRLQASDGETLENVTRPEFLKMLSEGRIEG